MKLPIRDEYFQKIKSGQKIEEYRDAHITFVNETTGEEITKEVEGFQFVPRDELPEELQKTDMFDDKRQMMFILK